MWGVRGVIEGYYIGMMSGTSMDGLDTVLCQFKDDVPSIIATDTRPFGEELKSAMLALSATNGVQAQGELDLWGRAGVWYSTLARQAVKSVLSQSKLSAIDVVAIGCHGQTVRHRPKEGFSLQLVDPNYLAEHTSITVVSDFRRRDMAVGGQGAPLVPAFHQAVFGDGSAILNLGGIANITVLQGDFVVGYDTGVANLLLDGWVNRHLGLLFDKDGAWGASGRVSKVLLDGLLTHPFLAKPAPKSTGREDFNLHWLEGILSQTAGASSLSPQDVQATLTEFTALTVSNELKKFNTKKLFVCGGGAYNCFLLTRLAHHLSGWQIQTTQKLGLNPTWVEAVAFAWLARQNLRMLPANVPSVTGASRKVVLGQVCFA